MVVSYHLLLSCSPPLSKYFQDLHDNVRSSGLSRIRRNLFRHRTGAFLVPCSSVLSSITLSYPQPILCLQFDEHFIVHVNFVRATLRPGCCEPRQTMMVSSACVRLILQADICGMRSVELLRIICRQRPWYSRFLWPRTQLSWYRPFVSVPTVHQ